LGTRTKTTLEGFAKEQIRGGDYNSLIDGGEQPIIKKRLAAAGDVNNEHIKRCYICKDNGWPREAIEFQKVNGRVKSDGTNEVKAWIIRDYFTGHIHEHKEPRIHDDDGGHV
jgi:hypothetical protein